MLDPVFRTLENRSEWRQFWKKEWYSPSEKAVSEIEFYSSNRKTDDARAVLAELRKNYPGTEDVVYSEALINISAGKYSEALRGLSDLTASDPANVKYLRVLAKAQSLSGSAAGASNTYSKLLDAGVADADLLVSRAECYRKTGETDKALSDIEHYLDLYPENRKALSMAGKLEMANGDNIKALGYFSKNLKLHPDDPECYVDRADSYFGARSWEWAVKDYSMSLDLSPANPDAWLNKGIALLNMSRVEDACHDFKRALSLGSKRATEYISSNCIK
jgi:tetratricopeptide (TPR) repeat protein